jgi:hypothetical protein
LCYVSWQNDRASKDQDRDEKEQKKAQRDALDQ